MARLTRHTFPARRSRRRGANLGEWAAGMAGAATGLLLVASRSFLSEPTAPAARQPATLLSPGAALRNKVAPAFWHDDASRPADQPAVAAPLGDWAAPNLPEPLKQGLGRLVDCPGRLTQLGHPDQLGADGGWITCLGAPSFRQPRPKTGECVVYSVGVKGDVSFELDARRRLGCEVHSFDPTVDYEAALYRRRTGGAAFHKVGLGGYIGDMPNVGESVA